MDNFLRCSGDLPKLRHHQVGQTSNTGFEMLVPQKPPWMDEGLTVFPACAAELQNRWTEGWEKDFGTLPELHECCRGIHWQQKLPRKDGSRRANDQLEGSTKLWGIAASLQLHSRNCKKSALLSIPAKQRHLAVGYEEAPGWPGFLGSWNYLRNGHQCPDVQKGLSAGFYFKHCTWGEQVATGWVPQPCLHTGGACTDMGEKQMSPVGQDLAAVFTCLGANCKYWKVLPLGTGSDPGNTQQLSREHNSSSWVLNTALAEAERKLHSNTLRSKC